MRLWVEVARRSFRRHSTYRAASAAGLFTNCVFGFLKAAISLALFRHRDDIGGFDAVDAVTFAWITQGFFAVIWSGLWELGDRIKTGAVAIDLYRPADFQAWWLAQDLGRFGYQTLVRGIPPVLVGAAFYELRYPRSLGTWMAFLVSVGIAVMLAFGWWFTVQMSGFWLLDANGPVQVAHISLMFLSGFIVPLTFFPESVASLVRLLPPASMLQLPAEVFLGRHQGLDLVGVLGLQLAWATAFVVGGRILLRAADHKVVVQGG